MWSCRPGSGDSTKPRLRRSDRENVRYFLCSDAIYHSMRHCQNLSALTRTQKGPLQAELRRLTMPHLALRRSDGLALEGNRGAAPEPRTTGEEDAVEYDLSQEAPACSTWYCRTVCLHNLSSTMPGAAQRLASGAVSGGRLWHSGRCIAAVAQRPSPTAEVLVLEHS